MIKFSYSPYKLIPSAALNAKVQTAPRDGALLKVAWPDGKVGYSDIFPWPEFGDLALEEQLKLLKTMRLSPLLEQSFWLAQRDAEARLAKKALVEPSPSLRNNFVVSDVLTLTTEDVDSIKARGFEILKVKVGRNFPEEAKALNRIANSGKVLLRLDINGLASWAIFQKFMASLDKRTIAHIDYVEDPIPFEPIAWKECRRIIRIAMDFQRKGFRWSENEEPPFDVIVLKPSQQDVDETMKWASHWNRKVTVTSNMDHPIGMLHAYSIAQELSLSHSLLMNDPGCLTYSQYQRINYSMAIEAKGPYIQKVPGVGIGFDKLLSEEQWKPA